MRCPWCNEESSGLHFCEVKPGMINLTDIWRYARAKSKAKKEKQARSGGYREEEKKEVNG